MMKALLPLFGLTTTTLFAGTTAQVCPPEPGAPCYSVDKPACQYCLGPEQVNPSVGPFTCNGDVTLIASALYWTSHQDGMAFAIDNAVFLTNADPMGEELLLNNLIDAKYLNPHSAWNFGWKLGLGYTGSRDGWDIRGVWTSFQGTASSHNETETDDNRTMVALWSAWTSNLGSLLYAIEINTSWKNDLNLFDLDLGRDFWVSKYLSLRPHIGIRYSSIKQDFKIEHKGGSWMLRENTPQQNPFNGIVHLQNDFLGTGARLGLDSTWHLGRGWSLFNEMAISALYGRFRLKHEEFNREAVPSYTKTLILETEEKWKATRFTTDLLLGIEWSTLFSDCRYQFTIALAWEQHLFLSQNQMWRIERKNASVNETNTGENVYEQRRGDLDYEGLTLTLKFDF